MLTLIRNGGVIPMLFLLFTGGSGLIAAFYFALRAQRRTLGFIQQLALATFFGTLAATCADTGATLNAVSRELTHDRTEVVKAFHIMIEGLAESTSPGILGFTFLGLTWMLVAVGKRRLDEREAASVKAP